MVQLDQGVNFPLTNLSQIFVRGCYVDLLKADEMYRELKTLLSLTYVTGTPGKCVVCVEWYSIPTVTFSGLGTKTDTISIELAICREQVPERAVARRSTSPSALPRERQ